MICKRAPSGLLVALLGYKTEKREGRASADSKPDQPTTSTASTDPVSSGVYTTEEKRRHGVMRFLLARLRDVIFLPLHSGRGRVFARSTRGWLLGP